MILKGLGLVVTGTIALLVIRDLSLIAIVLLGLGCIIEEIRNPGEWD